MTSIANHNQTSKDSYQKISNSERNLFISLLFIALIIRLVASYIQPAFLDEGYVYYTARAGFSQMIHELKIDVHPPTCQLAIYPLIQRTSSIFILRLPFVLCGLASLYAILALARRFMATSWALAIVGIAVLNRATWITDAQLRSYAPLTLSLLLVWASWIDILRGDLPLRSLGIRSSKWGWGIFFMAALSASSLHIIGTISISALLVLTWKVSPSKRLVCALFTAILPCAIWFIWSRLTRDTAGIKENFSVPFRVFVDTPLSILGGWDFQAFINYFGDSPTGQLCSQILPGAYLIVNIALWAIFFAGCWTMLEKRIEGTISMICAFLVPMCAIFIADRLHMCSFQPRYMAPFVVPFIILSLHSLSERAKKIWIGSILSIGVLNSLLMPFCPALWNQNWQSTLDFISRTQHPGDTIAVHIPSAVYGFSMAYDAENIGYIFKTEGISNVQAYQDVKPGKLRVIPLGANMMTEDMLNFWGDRRLYLVICQADPSTPAVLNWLNQYYDVIDNDYSPSFTYWSTVNTLLLKKRNI